MSRVSYTMSTHPFIADVATIVRNVGRQIDWTLVPDTYQPAGSQVLVTSGANALGVTTFVVDALPGPIPPGTNLYFGTVGEFVRTTAYAPAGATSLTVEATLAAIEDNDTAIYVVPSGVGTRTLPAGTIMVEVAASGKMVPYAARPGAETASMILESAASADDGDLGILGYGCIIGGVIYSNLLPEAAAVGFATRLTELHAAGTGFKFETYVDNRS